MKELTAYDRFLERQRIAEEQHIGTPPTSHKCGPCKQTKSGPVAIERLTAKGRDALAKIKEKNGG